MRAGTLLVCVQEKYLLERIKVDGKTNNFQKVVALERAKNKIVLTSEIPFSKRLVYSLIH